MGKGNPSKINLPKIEKQERIEVTEHYKFGRVYSIQEEIYDASGILQGERWKNAKGVIVETIEFVRDETGKIIKEIWKNNEGKPYFVNEYEYDQEGKYKGKNPKRLTEYDPEPLYEGAYNN